MPALLRPEQFDAWLDGSVGKEVLGRHAPETPEVSKRAARACSCVISSP